MWKNYVGPGRPQTTDMRIACWIPKATNTHLEYVIPIAFPLQRWSYERASMLRYAHTACLFFFFLQIFSCPKIVAKRRKVSFKTKIGGRKQSRKSAACAISLRIFRETYGSVAVGSGSLSSC